MSVSTRTSDDNSLVNQSGSGTIGQGAEQRYLLRGSRARTHVNVALVLSLILTALATGLLLHEGPRRVGIPIDTQVLVRGMSANIRCVRDGAWVGCIRHIAADPELVLSLYPIQQSVPAMLFRIVGLDESANIRALIWVNVGAVLSLLVTLILVMYRKYGFQAAVLAGMLAVPGLLIPYAFHSFGEPIAALIIAAICICGLAHERTWPWILPLSAMAAMGKENLLPAIVLFGLGFIQLGGGSRPAKLRSASTMFAGVAVGLIVSAAYNVFRFGGLVNDVYVSNPRASLDHVPMNALGLLFSPNGGISWHWPGVVISLGVLMWAVAKPRAGERQDGRWLGGVMILAAFLIELVIVSVWWTPFGGYSYGTRLLVPVGLPVIIAAVAVVARRTPGTSWLIGRGGGVLALIASAVLLPALGVVFAPESDGHHINEHLKVHPECAGGGPPSLTVEQWEQCETDWVWSTEHLTMAQNVPRTFSGNETYWLCAVSSIVAVWLALTASQRYGDCQWHRRRGREVAEDVSLPV
jgi:hypothetical protein